MNRIPIRNIYYLLCYAWNIDIKPDEIFSGDEEFKNIYDLLGTLYYKDLTVLLKRGINKSYLEYNDRLTAIRGKINFPESICQTDMRSALICEYDELSSDIVFNQILKTILYLLLSKNISIDLKNKLKKLTDNFLYISAVKLTDNLFSRLRYNRNNKKYRILMHISELIYSALIPDSQDGVRKYYTFYDKQKMAKIYEKFVLNFYIKHLNRARYKVHNPNIEWILDHGSEKSEILPIMRTDIVITDKFRNKQLIIDTKYYRDTLSGNEKARANHIYQVYAYLSNSIFDGEKIGMLLYPVVVSEHDHSLTIKDKNIYIKTINLAETWDNIENKLIKLIYQLS